ncbi:Uric acid transporter UacT [compost metagenome]
MIVAVSLGMGMIPMVSDKFFARFPSDIGTLLNSGVALCAISAIVLNYLSNGRISAAEAEQVIRDSATTSH